MKTKKPNNPDKPVMIGARIHPRLQYGLRLLARVQGGTIAEAVEWAINLALRQTRIGGAGNLRLAGVVELVWNKPTEAQQIHILNKLAPELLDFDQRSAWNLVIRCAELWRNAFYAFEHDDEGAPIDVEIDEDDPRARHEHSETLPRFDIIEQHWDAIRALGLELGRAGEIENRYTLAEILDGTARERAGLTS